MDIKELRALLAGYPEDREVYVWDPDSLAYGVVTGLVSVPAENRIILKTEV